MNYKKNYEEFFDDGEYSNEKESESSPRQRDIFIYFNKYYIKVHPKNLFEFKTILKNINFPFYIIKRKFYSLKLNDNINKFWDKTDYKILYENYNEPLINELTFITMHCPISTNNFKKFSPAVRFYFKENKTLFFNEKLLNMNTMNLLKRFFYLPPVPYNKAKITGIKGSGKTTLILYFFRRRKNISFFNCNNIEEVKAKINRLKEKVQNKQIYFGASIFFQNYKKNLYDSINNKYEFKEADSLSPDYTLNINSDNNIDDDCNSDVIKLDENKEQINIDNNNNENNDITNKEFKDQKFDEMQYFISSIYFNLDINFDSKHFYMTEMMDLFKTFDYYMILKNYLFYKKNEINNVWDLIKYVITFIDEYKYTLKRRVFIIIDQIDSQHIEELLSIEKLAKDIKDLYLIEIFSTNEYINIHDNDNKCLKINHNYTSFRISELESSFGDNAFYSTLWSNNEEKKNLEEFIKNNMDLIRDDITKFYQEKNICTSIVEKKINNKIYNDEKDFMMKIIPFKYFYINKNKLIPGFKAIEEIYKELSNNIDFIEIFQNDKLFFKFEKFSQGDILEKVFKDDLIKLSKKIYKDEVNIIDIGEILQKGVKEFLDDKDINDILLSNKEFKKIIGNYTNTDLNSKIFIITQNNNGKHYDLAVVMNINGIVVLILFQVTINKAKNKIEKMKKFLFIDINMIQIKIELLLKLKINKIFTYMVFLKEQNNKAMIKNSGYDFNFLFVERKKNIIQTRNENEFDFNINNISNDLFDKKKKEKDIELQKRNKLYNAYEKEATNFLINKKIKFKKLLRKNYYIETIINIPNYLIFYQYEKVTFLEFKNIKIIQQYKKEKSKYKIIDNIKNKSLNDNIRKIFLFEIIYN